METARSSHELLTEATKMEAEQALKRSGGFSERPDLLEKIGELIKDLGYAGDLRQPLLVYLSLTSRLLPQPANIVLYGPSSAGKTFIIDIVSSLFPKSAVYNMTASSERALVYSEEPFKNRFVIVSESTALHQDSIGTTILRSIAWGGHIAYDTVEKTPKGFRGRRIEKDGPTGVATTATKALEPELANRFLALEVPDDPKHTKAILTATAARVERTPTSPDIAPLRSLQEWLQLSGTKEVVVPFASQLAELFPAQLVRARRDFRQLLTLIQAHALLFQRQRKHDRGGKIIAEIFDYKAVYDLAFEIFSVLASGGVTEILRSTVEAVVAINEGKLPIQRDPVTVTVLAKQLGIHRTTAYRRAIIACELGYLVNMETRPKRPLQLEPGEPLPEENDALPYPDSIQIS